MGKATFNTIVQKKRILQTQSYTTFPPGEATYFIKSVCITTFPFSSHLFIYTILFKALKLMHRQDISLSPINLKRQGRRGRKKKSLY